MIGPDSPIPSKFPKLTFKKDTKLVSKLLNLSHNYDIYNKTLSGNVVDILVNMLDNELARECTPSRPALIASVTDYINTNLDSKNLGIIFGRIVSNRNRICKVLPVGRFNPQKYNGWSCLEIYDATFSKVNNIRNVTFSLRCLSGLAYGLEFNRTYTYNHPSVDTLMYKLGANRKGTTGSPRELVRLRFWGEIVQRRLEFKEVLTFSRWSFDAQLKAYNQSIIKLRRKPCPAGYKHACVECSVGYDICPAGCRQTSIKETTNLEASKLVKLTVKGNTHDSVQNPG